MKIDVHFWEADDHMFSVQVDSFPPYAVGQEIFLNIEAPEAHKYVRMPFTGYRIVSITHGVKLELKSPTEGYQRYKMEVFLEKLP